MRFWKQIKKIRYGFGGATCPDPKQMDSDVSFSGSVSNMSASSTSYSSGGSSASKSAKKAGMSQLKKMEKMTRMVGGKQIARYQSRDGIGEGKKGEEERRKGAAHTWTGEVSILPARKCTGHCEWQSRLCTC